MGVLDREGRRTFASSSTDNQVCDPLQENQLNVNLVGFFVCFSYMVLLGFSNCVCKWLKWDLA